MCVNVSQLHSLTHSWVTKSIGALVTCTTSLQWETILTCIHPVQNATLKLYHYFSLIRIHKIIPSLTINVRPSSSSFLSLVLSSSIIISFRPPLSLTQSSYVGISKQRDPPLRVCRTDVSVPCCVHVRVLCVSRAPAAAVACLLPSPRRAIVSTSHFITLLQCFRASRSVTLYQRAAPGPLHRGSGNSKFFFDLAHDLAISSMNLKQR